LAGNSWRHETAGRESCRKRALFSRGEHRERGNLPAAPFPPHRATVSPRVLVLHAKVRLAADCCSSVAFDCRCPRPAQVPPSCHDASSHPFMPPRQPAPEAITLRGRAGQCNARSQQPMGPPVAPRCHCAAMSVLCGYVRGHTHAVASLVLMLSLRR